MKVKFKLQSNKNGYLQIDFAIALLIFFFFFLGIYTYYFNQLNSYDSNSQTLILNSQSTDICKLLIISNGNPNNWETNILNLKFIGLKKINFNYLDSNKITVLNSTNYGKILDKLNINSNLNIQIINISNNYFYLNFGAKSSIYSKEKSSSICYSIYEKTNPVKIIIEVWK